MTKSLLKITGENGMSVSVIAHSKAANGTNKDITTFELEYPRFVHAELMTHRVFSRNAASSRAIPVKTMIETILRSPATPVHWGANQAGMQAKEQLKGWRLKAARIGWNIGMRLSVGVSRFLTWVGLHKQLANRGTEAYQMMKVVVTSTEWKNFFYLRDHPDAQPEIAHLAALMHRAMLHALPKVLKDDEWHMPYFEDGYWSPRDSGCTLEYALKISSSCCAQVSFRKNNDSFAQAEKVWKRLVESKPVHASPFEHQAKPMLAHHGKQKRFDPRSWDMYMDLIELPFEDGVTHVDTRYNAWSGNFCGFIQHRQLIKDHVKEG